MPHGLSDKIDSNTQSRQLLNRYGLLLSDCTKVNTNKAAIKFPTGTLLSLPGGVAHAGPKSNGFRAVLFFTGTPDGCPPYDPDVQHCKTTLVSELLRLSWKDMSAEEREYLLSKWNELGFKKDKTQLGCVTHKHLIAIGVAIQRAKLTTKKNEIIKAVSKDKWWEVVERWDNGDYDYQPP